VAVVIVFFYRQSYHERDLIKGVDRARYGHSAYVWARLFQAQSQ